MTSTSGSNNSDDEIPTTNKLNVAEPSALAGVPSVENQQERQTETTGICAGTEPSVGSTTAGSRTETARQEWVAQKKAAITPNLSTTETPPGITFVPNNQNAAASCSSHAMMPDSPVSASSSSGTTRARRGLRSKHRVNKLLAVPNSIDDNGQHQRSNYINQQEENEPDENEEGRIVPVAEDEPADPEFTMTNTSDPYIAVARLVNEESTRDTNQAPSPPRPDTVENLNNNMEQDDMLTIQDAMPLRKQYQRFALIIGLLVLVIAAVVGTVVGVIVKDNNNNNNNNNNSDTLPECSTSFNNDESVCGILLHGLSLDSDPDNNSSDCDCFDCCNGKMVGCYKFGEESHTAQNNLQISTSCSGQTVVAGCTAFMTRTPLFVNVKKLTTRTLQALTDPSTPQATGYRWLLHHPQLDSMTEERKLQLFALATWYHSTQP